MEHKELTFSIGNHNWDGYDGYAYELQECYELDYNHTLYQYINTLSRVINNMVYTRLEDNLQTHLGR